MNFYWRIEQTVLGDIGDVFKSSLVQASWFLKWHQFSSVEFVNGRRVTTQKLLKLTPRIYASFYFSKCLEEILPRYQRQSD